MTTASSAFVYVTFIRTTPEGLWNAVIDPQFMQQYWFGMHFKTDWQMGSHWQLLHADGRVNATGEIVEIDPPKRLVLKWLNEYKPELKAEGYSQLTMELEPLDGAVKLSINHGINQPESKVIQAVSVGWPSILSNLKSLLETGEVVLQTHPAAKLEA